MGLLYKTVWVSERTLCDDGVYRYTWEPRQEETLLAGILALLCIVGIIACAVLLLVGFGGAV